MKNREELYNVLLCLLTDIMRQSKQVFIGFTKIKALFYYIKVIKVIRSAYIRIFLIILSFIIMIHGFLFLHISVLYYFSMSREVRALIILSLGVVYFMIPVGGLLFFTSQKVWMKLAKANEIIRKAVGETSGSEMR